MIRVVERGLYYLSLELGIVCFAFILFHAIPSDPARVALGPNAEEAQVAAFRQELGLNASLLSQFLSYIGRVACLDLGRSYVDGRSVRAEVLTKLGVSLLLLGFSAIVVLLYVSTIFGIEASTGTRVGTYADFLWVSTPTMFSGVLIALLSVRFWPFSRFSGALTSVGDYLYFVPPAFVLALYPMAILSRIATAEARQVGNATYIRAARALGLTEFRIVSKYVLKNISVPVLTAFANQIPILFTGAFIVEAIFSIPGVGSLLIRSLLQRDFPMLEGLVILNGLVVLTVYLLVEAVYPLVDPRIGSKHAG